jgi:nitric oxide reductase NorE protein
VSSCTTAVGTRGEYATSQGTLHAGLGLLNTVVLLAGSLFLVLAARRVADRRHSEASRLLLAAVACASVFGVVKAMEYAALAGSGYSIYTNAFYMVFFVITGAHLLHVVVAAGALALLRSRVSAGLTGPRDAALFETGHMVDLLWLILFSLRYLVH